MSENDYLELIRKKKAAELQQTMAGVADAQPDVEAKLRKLAADYNLPVEAVRLDRPTVERRSKIDSVDYATLAKEHKLTSELFLGGNNAAVVHDDLDNLAATEKAWGYLKNTGSSLASGIFGFSEGLAGSAEAGADFVRRSVTTPLAEAGILPVDIGGPISQVLQGIRQSQRDWRNYLMPQGSGNVEQGIYSGLQSLTSNAIMVPFAVMTGNPMLMLNSMAAITGGQSYGKAKDKGLGFERALTYAASDAVVEKATELAPALKLFADLNVGAPFFKMLGNQLVAEIPQEQIATLAQDFNEWAALSPDQTFGDYLKARPDAAAQTLIATVVGTGGMVSVMKGADAVLNRQDKAQRALLRQGQMEALQQYTEASKVAKRDPALYQGFIDQLAEKSADHVYIDPKQLQQSGLSNQLFQAVPELEEAFYQAANTGTDLSIRTSDFVTRIANQAWVGPLLDHVRQEDEDYSPAEARAFLAKIPQETAKEFENVLTQRATDQQIAQESAAIEERIYQSLESLGRFNATVNRHYANLQAQYYEVQAQRFGVSPQALFERYPAGVESEIGGRVYNQDSEINLNLSEDQKKSLLNTSRWLDIGLKLPKNAKIYRGISETSGSHSAMLGRGLYTTTDLKQAESYGNVIELTINDLPRNPVRFSDELAFNQWEEFFLFEVLGLKRKSENKLHVDEWVRQIDPSIDGIQIGKGKGSYFVKFPDNQFNQQKLSKPAALPEKINIDGVERWTVNSNGQPIAQDDAGIKNFWAWFSPSPGQLLDGLSVAEVSSLKRDTDALSDFIESQAGLSESDRFTVIPSSVFAHVASAVNNDKILDAVVRSLPVDVVNFLGGKQGSAKRVLHDSAMLEDVFSINPASDVALGVNPSRIAELTVRVVANAGAKITGLANGSLKRNSAVLADANDSVLGAHVRKSPSGDLSIIAGFGESKVVDDQGRPLVVYHGTGGDFSEFKTFSSWFSKSSKFANEYAGLREHQNTGSSSVMPAYIVSGNAFNGDALPKTVTISQFFTELLKQSGVNDNDKIKQLKEMLDTVKAGAREEESGPHYSSWDFWHRPGEFFGENGHVALKNAFDLTGFDSINFTEDGEYTVGVLNNTQIKSAIGNTGQFSPTNPNILNQQNRGSYSPDSNIITLSNNADLSTFLHESGHMFLEMQMNMISRLLQEDALIGTTELQKQLIKDTETLLKWFGLDRVEDWFNLDFEQKRAYHEQFAESFEKYLFEGKAPSLALQRLFSTFRQWLSKVYEHAKSYLAPGQLTDEVRQVFDRMLATDEEIKLVNQARSLLPLFESPDASGMTPEAFAAYQAAHQAQTSEAMEALALKGVKDMQWLANAKNRTLKKLQKQHQEARRMTRAEVRFEVMSQPAYRAWAFLTGKIAPEDKMQSFEKAKRDPNFVQADSDSLFTAIAKLGGLDYDAVAAEWGYDQPGRAKMPVFGKPVVRKSGGLSLETMAEKLLEHGYLTADEHGKHDIRELEDRFDAELRGDLQYSHQFDGGDWYGGDVLAGSHVVNPSALKNGRLDIDSLKGFDLPESVIAALVERGMTAKQGFHPDVISDVLPGFDSGDALVRTMAEIEPPNALIERLTDERMLTEHAELSSPEAIERAANEALYSEAHTRFIKTEINTLDKATGKKSLLAQTADMVARQMIDRLKIRDLKPHLYARAEARAAKAAKEALTRGQREQAAAEKRNQLLNSQAAKYAFEAEDEVSKWLKYFKGFYKGNNKADPIDIEDLNFILALLDKYDFKFISNRQLSDNLKIRDWVQSRLAAGEPVPYLSEAILSGPELAAYLRAIEVRDANGDLIYVDEVEQTKRLAEAIDASQRKYYKEATIEEMRGLYDTVQALETAARLRQKAFTADKNETIAQIQADLAASIAEHGGKGGKNVGTRTDFIGSKWQKVQGFTSNTAKVPMWARIMDGWQDGGPVWRYFIKPANDRANMESRMKSEVTEKLDAILRPITSKASINDKAFKGKVVPGLGFSMTWQERFAVALNVGNESNYQRLEGGGIAGKRDMLTPREIQVILGTLTADELHAIQDIWDLIETYKPLIQAQLKRMNLKEPTWIKPRPIHITSADGVEVRLRGGYFPVVFDTLASTQAKANDKATTLKEAMQAANNHATTRRGFLKERVQAVKRPLLLSQQSIYSGINDVIHSLAWQEWIMDVNRFLKAEGPIDKAILEYYGADVRDVFHKWRDDIVLGQRRLDDEIEIAAGFIRRNVSVAAMAFNVNTALLQPLGLFNSGPRVGWGWLGRGLEKYIEDPIEATKEARRLSPFLQNRMLNRFRDLNELQTMVSGDSRYHQMLGQYGFWLMVHAQSIADVPTWWAAYYKALDRDSLDEALAIAQADQAVKDSQGGGEDVDLSGMERGGALLKLFTAFYSYMATTASLSYGLVKTEINKKQSERNTALTAVNLLLVLGVAPQLGWMLKEALQPGGGDDDDELAAKMIKEELAFLFGLVVLGREVGSMISGGLSGYHGPPGIRMLVDGVSLSVQAGQGEFDDAFRKSFINLLGDLTGIPSAQLNKTITGAEALNAGDTDNPAALLLGYKS